jgi:hypothetical protein
MEEWLERLLERGGLYAIGAGAAVGAVGGAIAAHQSESRDYGQIFSLIGAGAVIGTVAGAILLLLERARRKRNR